MIFLNLLVLLYVYKCLAYMYVCVPSVRLQRSEVVIRPTTWVLGVDGVRVPLELQCLWATIWIGNWTQVLCKSASVLNLWAILQTWFIIFFCDLWIPKNPVREFSECFQVFISGQVAFLTLKRNWLLLIRIKACLYFLSPIASGFYLFDLNYIWK